MDVGEMGGFEFVEAYMEYDCGFEKGNNWFRYRTGGVLIHNNKMLFVKSAVGDYYYMIGGGVHLGEKSNTCIEREVFEESGINARVEHLAVVCENFFKGIGGKIDGVNCHTMNWEPRSAVKSFSKLPPRFPSFSFKFLERTIAYPSEQRSV